MRNPKEEVKVWQKKLTEEVNQFNQKLQELVIEQVKIKDIEKLALSILEYNKIENEISDRGLILSELQKPLESLTSDYFKAELLDYLVAAETVGPELVDFLIEVWHETIRSEEFKDFEIQEEWQAHYKEYVLPGKILAHRFDQLDDLVKEMNEYLVRAWPDYKHQQSQGLIYYAFSKILSEDIKIEPILEGIKKDYEYLSAEDRNNLLKEFEEAFGIKRFEEARKQKVAMEKAIKILEKKEDKK